MHDHVLLSLNYILQCGLEDLFQTGVGRALQTLGLAMQADEIRHEGRGLC